MNDPTANDPPATDLSANDLSVEQPGQRHLPDLLEELGDVEESIEAATDRRRRLLRHYMLVSVPMAIVFITTVDASWKWWVLLLGVAFVGADLALLRWERRRLEAARQEVFGSLGDREILEAEGGLDLRRDKAGEALP